MPVKAKPKPQLNVELRTGDCIKLMRKMPDECIDAIVCDPPYGLGFMGKKWDDLPPGLDFAEEALRVLKPGGYCLAMGGTRTFHRLAVALEDAGFEIRDCLMWLYGSGFPKSHDVSKAIDKSVGAKRKVIGVKPGHEEFVGRKTRGHIDFKGATEGFDRPWMHDDEARIQYHLATAPTTKEAVLWQGWGTALKPAFEPIIVARKPFVGTVAKNVLKHRTGAINIDGCRIPLKSSGEDSRLGGKGKWRTENMAKNVYEGGYAGEQVGSSPLGRWPANVILDEEAAKMLDEQTGKFSAPKKARKGKRGGKGFGFFDDEKSASANGIWPGDDGGGVSRFFYVAKANKRERNAGLDDFEEKISSYMNTANGNPEKGSAWSPIDDRTGKRRDRFKSTTKNNHPTVKPIALMRWMVRLVTPPGGIVLDPFMGSGTTGIACVKEGFSFIGMDNDFNWVRIAAARINHWMGKNVTLTVYKLQVEKAKPKFTVRKVRPKIRKIQKAVRYAR